MLLHILIVDSDSSAAQVTREGIARALPSALLNLANSAESAREALLLSSPDLLIIDPAADSQRALSLIADYKAQVRQGHVLVLASQPTVTLRRQLRELNIDGYVEKPAPLSTLLDQLSRLGGSASQAPGSRGPAERI